MSKADGLLWPPLWWCVLGRHSHGVDARLQLAQVDVDGCQLGSVYQHLAGWHGAGWGGIGLGELAHEVAAHLLKAAQVSANP